MRGVLALVFALSLAACDAPTAQPAKTANASNAETAAPTRWDERLTDMLPAIDACIAKAPENRTVTYAAPDHAGLLVRIDGEEGELDCRVDADGSNARISRSDPELIVAGDGEAIFVRGPGENPGGECYEAPEVRDASGGLLGWMLDPAGC
jgi:hypothetical protein